MIEILDPRRDDVRIAGYRGQLNQIDGWVGALGELQTLRRSDPTVPDVHIANVDDYSRYVVYPWRKAMVRLPEETLFGRLRTPRLSAKPASADTSRWSSEYIAVAGLRRGSSVLRACVASGARRLRIAQAGTVDVWNLDATVCDLGVHQTESAARSLLEYDPYLDLVVHTNGINDTSALEFFGGDGALAPAVVIDESDDLEVHNDIRVRCAEARIPLVAVTCDDDDLIIDVWRNDLVGPLPESVPDHRELEPYGSRFGTLAALMGFAAAEVARRIVSGDGPPSGRVRVALRGTCRDSGPHPVKSRVRLSQREREVLETYTLGATVGETSAQHFISNHTVRSHYRRVTRRYRDADRPVSNKTALLKELIEDGWVSREKLRKR